MRPVNRTHLFLLGLILTLAAGLRAFGLSALGFWTDELCTLSCAQGWGLQFEHVPFDRLTGALPVYTRLAAAAPAWAVAPAMARDEAHPPLYFLLLRGWETAFGGGEAAVRSLDVVLSVAAIALLYAAAVPDVGPTVALWACLLMAVSTTQVQFAQEARNYVPVETFGLAAVVAVNRLRRGPSTAAAVGLGASLLAMMLTHYFAAGVATAVVATAAVRLRGPARRRAAIAVVAAAGLFVALWGPGMWRQRPNFVQNYAWVTDAGPGRMGRLVIRLSRVPARLVAEGNATAETVVGGAMLAGAVAVAVRRPAARPWVAWAGCGIGLVAVMDAARGTAQLSLMRYTLAAAPGVCVAVAAAVRGRWGWALPSAGVAVALIALPVAYVPAWKDDLRTPADIVGRRLGPADGLVVSGPDPVRASVAFAAFQHYLPRVPDAAAVLTRPADAAVLDRLRRCPHVWVVWMWPARPIDAFLPGYQAAESGQVPAFGEVAVGQLSAPRIMPR